MILAKKNNGSSEKTRELLIYITNKLKDKPNCGATVLNKALYFIDSMSYLSSKAPVSDLTYVKQDFGPTPKPAQFLSLRDNLINNGELEEVKSEYFGLTQRRYIPLRQPNLEFFSKEEIVLMDKVLDAVSGHNGSSISNFSHSFIAWQIAKTMDELPLNSILLTSKIPTETDLAWAKNKVAQYLN